MADIVIFPGVRFTGTNIKPGRKTAKIVQLPVRRSGRR